MTRPTPDTDAPSLEGADERAVLLAWIACQPGSRRVLAWPRFRAGYEDATIRGLPSRCPQGLRDVHRRAWILP